MILIFQFFHFRWWNNSMGYTSWNRSYFRYAINLYMHHFWICISTCELVTLNSKHSHVEGPLFLQYAFNLLVKACWNESNIPDHIWWHSLTQHWCNKTFVCEWHQIYDSMIWSGQKTLRNADKKRELQVSLAAFVQVAEKKNQSY